MKDKLTKTGHRKGYYKAKKFVVFLLSFFCLGIAASAPIFITQHVVEAKKAEEVSLKESNIENSSEQSNDIND